MSAPAIKPGQSVYWKETFGSSFKVISATLLWSSTYQGVTMYHMSDGSLISSDQPLSLTFDGAYEFCQPLDKSE